MVPVPVNHIAQLTELLLIHAELPVLINHQHAHLITKVKH